MRYLRGFSGWLWTIAAALLVGQLPLLSIQAQPAQQGDIEELKRRLEQLEQAPPGSAFEFLKSIQLSGFLDTTFNENGNVQLSATSLQLKQRVQIPRHQKQ